jgi:hypothetical protein
VSLPQVQPTRWQRVRAWIGRRSPFCWCFPPVVASGVIAIVCVGILICDVQARWAIEAKVDTIIHQNEQLTTENAKLRGQMADAIKAVRDHR